MTDEEFEYKSEEKMINTFPAPLDVSMTNGLECTWYCEVVEEPVTDLLMFSWKFNWDELKKKGIDRLSGYIHVTPPYKKNMCRSRCCKPDSDDSSEDYEYDFTSRTFDVDLNEPNQVVRCTVGATETDPYSAKFDYSFIPHYAKIEEVEKDSSSVQNDTLPIKKKKNSIANKKVNPDGIVSTTEQNGRIPEKIHEETLLSRLNKIFMSSEEVCRLLPVSTTEQNDGIPVEEGEKKAHVNEEHLSSDSDEMFSPSDQKDAILVIDGKKVHVNKWFLSYHSEFFRNLFVMDCKDGKMAEIPIGGIAFEDFKLLLGPFSSNPVFPTDETVEKLLELATRFKMSSVIHHCQHHLLHNSKFENEKMMWISEKYGMSDLLEKSILEIDTMEKAKKWNQTPEYTKLSDMTKIKVYEKLF